MGKQLYRTVKRCAMASLKAEMEINVSNLRYFCSAFQSDAAADWNDERPIVDQDLGVVRRM